VREALSRTADARPRRREDARRRARAPLRSVPPGLAPGAKRPYDAVGFEALADEIAEETLEFAIVGDRVPAAKPLAQRRLAQRLVVDPLEHGVERLLRRLPGDAGA